MTYLSHCPSIHSEHLAEEEHGSSHFFRANFTQKDEEESAQAIIKRFGVKGMRIMLPSILLAMQQWAPPVFYEEFWLSIPGRMRHLVSNYSIPYYENCIAAKRDAPFWQPTPKNRYFKRSPLKRITC